mmetsp:Transcript_60802/g.117196  ORF Transcript_60802/g.117196 Transcript_60802/m.117196 type:complete len:659 (-) Transcript_60802:190-2166(-)
MQTRRCDWATMAGVLQQRYALHAGLGLLIFSSLGLMQNSWHIRGTANGLHRQLRSTSSPLSTAILVAEPSKRSAFFSAYNNSRCLHLTSKPKKGLKLRIGECSEGKVQPTKFQIPKGNRGPIKLAEDPSLCLNAPGHGQLQLWSCDADKSHVEFELHSEPSGWVGVPHFDIADRNDAENMDASDLEAVIKRAEELGYAGFSVFKGRAYLKKVRHLTMNELQYMGNADPCVFYLRRNQSGDVSIRPAAKPDVCMLAPMTPGEFVTTMAPCKGPRSTIESAWTAGMVFRVEGDTELISEKAPDSVSSGLGSTAKPASEPVVTPSPVSGPVSIVEKATPSTTSIVEKATPSTTSILNVDTDMGSKTNAMDPASGTVRLKRLIIVSNVESIDYSKLQSNPPLATRFAIVIRDDLATMAGLGRNNIEVELLPGSVRSVSTLSMPETKFKDVWSKLQLDLLNERVASNIRLVEGIDTVKTGKISVVSYEETGEDVGGKSVVSTIHVPLKVLLLSSLLLLVAVVAIAAIMARGKSVRNVAAPPNATEPKEAEELEENLDITSPGAEADPADKESAGDSSTENDGLLGEELAVPIEEQEEKQEKVAGGGEEEAKEEEGPTLCDSPAPVAANASANSEEEDPDRKAAPAASVQEESANNPFADDCNT